MSDYETLTAILEPVMAHLDFHAPGEAGPREVVADLKHEHLGEPISVGFQFDLAGQLTGLVVYGEDGEVISRSSDSRKRRTVAQWAKQAIKRTRKRANR